MISSLLRSPKDFRAPGGPAVAALATAGAAWLAGLVFVVVATGAFGPLAMIGGAGVALLLFLLVTRPITGVLLGVFLLFTNLPVTLAEDGLVPRPVAGALVGLLFLPAVAHHLIGRKRPAMVDRTFGLLAAFLGALLLSALVAVDQGLALERIGVFAMEGLAVYFLVRNTVRDLPALRRVVAVLVGTAALLASLTVFQVGTGAWDRDFAGMARLHDEVEAGLVVPDEPRAERRARGPVDDPNRFAQILLLVAPLAFVRYLTATRTRTRVWSAGAGLMIVAAIFLTYSRGAFLTLAILVILLGAFRYVRPSRIVTAAVVVAFLVPTLVPGYLERVQSIAGVAGLFSENVAVEPDAVTRGRTTEMLAAVLAFRDHPVVGVGPGQYMPHYSVRYQLQPEISFRELPTPRRAHDLYVEVAAETGAVGLLVFLAIPAFLLLELWRLRAPLRRRRPDLEPLAGGFILGILGYLGTGVFLHLAYERYYWLFLALAGATVAILRNALRESELRDGNGPVATDGAGPPVKLGSGPFATAGSGPVERVGSGGLATAGTGPVERLGRGPLVKARSGPPVNPGNGPPEWDAIPLEEGPG